jgi:cystathionine gamma-synthase
MATPVVATSTFGAGGVHGYGRYSNPTWQALESALGSLDGGTAVTFSSGMAAVAAAQAVLLSGIDPSAAMVVPADGYHTTVALLAGLGRPLREVSMADTEAVVAALPGAALLWVECPTNPLLQVADLPALCAAARRTGTRVCVDATTATPLLLRPLEMGADLVVHAATKYLSGHSDTLLGAVVAGRQDLVDQAVAHRSMYGAIPGPFEAWLVLRGLRTLPVRLDRAQHTAGELARRLQAHPAVQRVRYPGLPGDPGHRRARDTMDGPGALIAIEVHGGQDAADAVAARTRLWVNTTSFGGVESTLERRRRWPGERPCVPASLLRLSVGLEDVEDLWDDLDAALTRP